MSLKIQFLQRETRHGGNLADPASTFGLLPLLLSTTVPEQFLTPRRASLTLKRVYLPIDTRVLRTILNTSLCFRQVRQQNTFSLVNVWANVTISVMNIGYFGLPKMRVVPVGANLRDTE